MGLTAADVFGNRVSFDNYKARHVVVDEGGSQSYQGVSEDQWNHWTDTQKLDDFLSGDGAGNSTGGAGMNGAIGPGDPHYQELHDRLGLKPDDESLISIAHVPNAKTGGASGFGAVFGTDAKQASLGDDYFAFTPEMISQARRNLQGGDASFWRNAIAIWGAVLGGAYMAGEFAAPAAGGTTGAVAATDAAESGGTLALSTTGTATTPYVPGAVTGATGATTGTTGFGPGAGDLGTDALGGTTPLPTTPTPTGPVPDPTPAPGPATQAPAPVTTGATPQPSTGIINSARNVAQPALDWYNGLSPAGRMVVNQGLSTAGNAVLQGIGQHNQQAAVEAADQRARDDVIRRGQVNAFAPGAITAKPKPKSASTSLVPVVPVPGIIDAVRSQG